MSWREKTRDSAGSSNAAARRLVSSLTVENSSSRSCAAAPIRRASTLHARHVAARGPSSVGSRARVTRAVTVSAARCHAVACVARI